MTLKEYIMETPEGEEITVWDNDYDIEVYFYNQNDDAWDNAMMKLASKLNVVEVTNDGVVVDMYDLIDKNIGNIEKAGLFNDVDTDLVMDYMDSILAGNVSERWITEFVNCLKSDVGASKRMPKKRYIKNYSKFNSRRMPTTSLPDLDERFSFDIDDEFELGLDTIAEYALCFVTDSKTIGNGAGVEYTVIVAVPSDRNHWQMKEDIERNLDRYIQDITDGSDYTGSVISVESNSYAYDIPDEIFDTCALYEAHVEVVAIQNISPWGDYGIDYGTEDYFDHVTKGTPFPRDYE